MALSPVDRFTDAFNAVEKLFADLKSINFEAQVRTIREKLASLNLKDRKLLPLTASELDALFNRLNVPSPGKKLVRGKVISSVNAAPKNGYAALPYERRCEIARKAAATRKRKAEEAARQQAEAARKRSERSRKAAETRRRRKLETETASDSSNQSVEA